MAIFFADSFDHYGNEDAGETNMLKGNYVEANGGLFGGPQTTVKRTGLRSFRFYDESGSILRRVFSEPKDVLGVSLAFMIENLPSTESATAVRIMRVTDTTNTQLCSITLATTGALRVRNAAGTILFSSAAGVITAGGFNHIEARFIFANGDGEVEVRVNEVTVIDIQDVDIGPPATAEQFAISDSAGAASFGNFYVDDLVLWDDLGTENNDFLGDVSVFTHMPNADTAQADWSPSTGSTGYVIIDDIPPDADFLEATVAGDRSDFEMPTFSVGNIVAVKAVQRFSLVKKNGAGSSTFRQGVVSNATDAFGTIHSPGTSETYYNDLFQLNPDGSVAWDVAAVEDMQILIEKVT